MRKAALIATLPKSGTWYSHSFFWCYEQLLRNSDAYLNGTYRPDILGTLRHKKIRNISSHTNTFGIEKLLICHATCPGFRELNDPLNALWNSLHSPFSGGWGEAYYGQGEPRLRGHGVWKKLNPLTSPDARIVYLYRNPLDQFVSYYSHAKNHVDERLHFYALPDGERRPVQSMHDFVFNLGILAAFIRNYYSFRQMAQRYSNNVLLMPYEQLMNNPQESFGRILSFIGRAPGNVIQRHLFEEALAMCSKDALMAIESQLGHSMVGDQRGEGKHIRDGKIGKWKSHFSHTDIEKIEATLNIFHISLDDFMLTGAAEKISPLPWLANCDPAQKLVYQNSFLRQQLEWSGNEIGNMEKRLKTSTLWILKTLSIKYPIKLAQAAKRFLTQRTKVWHKQT